MEDLTEDLMSMEFHGTRHQRGRCCFPQTSLVTFVSQDARKKCGPDRKNVLLLCAHLACCVRTWGNVQYPQLCTIQPTVQGIIREQ